MNEIDAYKDGVAVEVMQQTRGWEILMDELDNLRSLAQKSVQDTSLADAHIVKSAVQRWTTIEGIINEIHIRLAYYVQLKDGMVNEAANHPADVTDPQMQIEVDRVLTNPIQDDDSDFSF